MILNIIAIYYFVIFHAVRYSFIHFKILLLNFVLTMYQVVRMTESCERIIVILKILQVVENIRYNFYYDWIYFCSKFNSLLIYFSAKYNSVTVILYSDNFFAKLTKYNSPLYFNNSLVFSNLRQSLY